MYLNIIVIFKLRIILFDVIIIMYYFRILNVLIVIVLCVLVFGMFEYELIFGVLSFKLFGGCSKVYVDIIVKFIMK